MRVLLAALLCVLLAVPPSATAAARWDFHFDWPSESAPALLRACSKAAEPQVVLRSDRGGAFLLKVSRSSGQSLRRQGDRLVAGDWQAGECVEAQIDLRAAGLADRYGLGYREGAFLRVSPLRWLWRPREMDPESRLRLRLPEGWSTSLPWPMQADGSHRLGATPGDWPAVAAFGRFTEHSVTFPGGALRVAVLPLADGTSDIRRWLDEVAGDLLQAYGRMPLADVQVLVAPLPGVKSPVPWGQVTRGGGSAVHLFVGAEAGYAGWRADWTATHEVAHLLHPFMGDAGRWLGEGMASYYQNVLRSRSGALSADEAKERLRAGFERGRRATPTDASPLAEDSVARRRGSTMRIYWAGAAFWLESDLHLRRHGDSLDRVLAEFAIRYLPSEKRWSPEAFIDALQQLAPAGDWQVRFATYASARRFPDSAALLDEIATASGRAAILLPRQQLAAAGGDAVPRSAE